MVAGMLEVVERNNIGSGHELWRILQVMLRHERSKFGRLETHPRNRPPRGRPWVSYSQ
jgi:hypothetical protein